MTNPTTETAFSSDPLGSQPTDSSKVDQAKDAASTAAGEGKHVAGVAKEEASNVAGEAATQVKSLAGEARTEVTTQVTDQTRQQRDKLVSTLSTLGDDLEQMADRPEGGGLAADLAREVSQHTRAVTSYLEGKEPGELLDDVRDLARRRPALFLFGALAAGVVAGRVARGVKDAGSQGPSASTQPVPTTPPTLATPVPSTPYPTTPAPSTPPPHIAAPGGTADGGAIPGYATGPNPPVEEPYQTSTSPFPGSPS